MKKLFLFILSRSRGSYFAAISLAPFATASFALVMALSQNSQAKWIDAKPRATGKIENTATGTILSSALKHPTVRTVQANNGRSVSYEIFPGLPGAPVYVTVNGLIYRYDWWDKLTLLLNSSGATVIRYSYSADPDSLASARSAVSQTPFSLDSLVSEIDAVLKDAKVSQVTLLTLSFGSIGLEYAAQRANQIERVVLMAPMIQPSDAYDPAGSTTRLYLQNIRKAWGEVAYDIQWRLLMEPLIRARVRARIESIPGYVPFGLSQTLVENGVFEKIRATRDFDLRAYSTPLSGARSRTELPRIDLILAGKEDPLVLKDQRDFWQRLDSRFKGNLVLMKDTAHALPGAAPEGTALVLGLLQEANGSLEKPFLEVETDSQGKPVEQRIRP